MIGIQDPIKPITDKRTPLREYDSPQERMIPLIPREMPTMLTNDPYRTKANV